MIKKRIKEITSAIDQFFIQLLTTKQNSESQVIQYELLSCRKSLREFFGHENGYYVALCSYTFMEEERKKYLRLVILPAQNLNHVYNLPIIGARAGTE